MIPIAQQLEEVQREIALREREYPRQVASGEMRQSVAVYRMECMRAVLRALEWLRDNQAAINTWPTLRHFQ
jgi:hypothetical protein